jgi:hypothetical protein
MSGAVTDLPHAPVRAHAERSRPDAPTKWDYAAPRSETQVGTTGSRVGRARAVSSARRAASTRSRRRARLKPSSRPSATAARAECGRAEVRTGGLTAADRAARDILFRAASKGAAQRASGRQGSGRGGATGACSFQPRPRSALACRALPSTLRRRWTGRPQLSPAGLPRKGHDRRDCRGSAADSCCATWSRHLSCAVRPPVQRDATRRSTHGRRRLGRLHEGYR